MGGPRHAVLSFSTSPPVSCLPDLYVVFFLFTFSQLSCSISSSFLWWLHTSLLSWHSRWNASQLAKQIKCFSKSSSNQKFCHLLPPKIRCCLSFLHQDLQQPPLCVYSWPHLSWGSMFLIKAPAHRFWFLSALFWLWLDSSVTWQSCFPSWMRTEKEDLEVWMFQLWRFQTVPPTKSQKSSLFPVTSQILLFALVSPK